MSCMLYMVSNISVRSLVTKLNLFIYINNSRRKFNTTVETFNYVSCKLYLTL